MLSLAVLIIAAVLFTFLSDYSPKRVRDAVEIFGGFSTTPSDETLTAVIKAVLAYLKTDSVVRVSSYALPVGPVRELSVPHGCLGVREDANPYSLNQLLTDKKDIAALGPKQRHYSGVIPASATKAL